MANIQPIGSVFEWCYPPSRDSTDPTFHLWRYKVIGHAETRRGPSMTLEAMDCTKYEPDHYKVDVFGNLLPVPPKEIAHHFPPQ